MERYLDPVVSPGERLVDAVVDHLVHEMVEAARAGRADVHARPQADRLEGLEHGDVLGRIRGLTHGKRPANSLLAGDLGTSGGRQRLDERLHPRRGAEAAELSFDIATDAVHQAALTAPGETSRSWAGATGREEASVAVMRVWPVPSTRSARTRRR